MKFVKIVDGPITSHWDEPRPLSNPGLWPHASVDIAGPVDARMVAPENGWPYCFALFRPEGREDEWKDELKASPGTTFPWGMMRHDVFGTVIVLKGQSGLVHHMTHVYFAQAFERGLFPKSAWHYQEERPDRRFVMGLWHTFGTQRYVQAGEQIGLVGNAGQSSGAHVHWTIHNGWVWTPHELRIDPEKHLRE